jgi:hypothetical protein
MDGFAEILIIQLVDWREHLKTILIVLSLLSCVLLAGTAIAQAPAAQAPAAASSHTPFTVGVAARASTLGFGADIAVPVMHRANARVGFNFFNYDRTFDKDKITYAGTLHLESVQALFDLFPFAGNFHVSPGVLLYNGNRVNANASAPISQTFTLGGNSYTATGTLTGTAKMEMNKAAPMFMFGWGNLVPRSHRHIVFSAEAGFVYQGSPSVTLNLAGNACTQVAGSPVCGNVASLPIAQTDVAAEQAKLNHDVSPFKFYPVIAFSFGYKF